MNLMYPELYSYQIAKQVYEKTLSNEEGIDKLVNDLNMNRGSAHIIILQVFPKLINGEYFTRTLSVSYFDCFLDNILKDYGFQRLSIALSALKMHIDYIATKGDSKKTLRQIFKKYSDILNSTPISKQHDEIEQNELTNIFSAKTKSEIKNELKNTLEQEDEIITINRKAYKRDNKTIALIKILRDNKCQICGYSITKKNGAIYIEAAHIIPKHKRGKETPGNIILLCPNHHKEFDFGNCDIKKHNENFIEFILNNVIHKINLAID